MNALRNGAGGEASLWLRWVFANAVGEAVGLGGGAPEFVAPQTVDGIGHLEVSARHPVLG